jgi:hypothetical protein
MIKWVGTQGSKIPCLRRCEFFASGFEKMLVLYHHSPHGIEILRLVHGTRNIAALLRREGVE